MSKLPKHCKEKRKKAKKKKQGEKKGKKKTKNLPYPLIKGKNMMMDHHMYITITIIIHMDHHKPHRYRQDQKFSTA